VTCADHPVIYLNIKVDEAPWFNDQKIERAIIHLLNGAITPDLLIPSKNRTGYKLQSEFDTYTVASCLVSGCVSSFSAHLPLLSGFAACSFPL
jgi:hypothetical protein